MKKSAKRLLGLALSFVMAVSLLPAALTTSVYAAESDDSWIPMPAALIPSSSITASDSFATFGLSTPSLLTASTVSTSGSSTITNAYGFEITEPDDFDSETIHPYGNGATTVNLSPVKEIGVFESSANTWHSRVYNFTEATMVGTDPNKNLFSKDSQSWIHESVFYEQAKFFHPSTAMTTQMMAASSPLENAGGTSLDPGGNGRDNVVAYYGRNRTSGQLQLYVYAANKNGNHDTVQGASWTGSAASSYSWMSETTAYNNEGYLSIVSGDFDGDGKDTMILYDPAAGNLQLREFKVTDETHGTVSQVVSYSLGSRGFLKDKFGKTPNAIQKMSGSTAKARNTAMVQMAVGDVDRDYCDELIVTVSLPNMLDENGGITNRSSVLMVLDKNKNDAYFTCSWAQQLKDVYDKDKTSPCSGTEGWLMRAASSAVGDIDGDGFPEILTVGVGSDDNADDDNFWSDGYFAVITEYNKGYSIATTKNSTDGTVLKGYLIPEQTSGKNKDFVGQDSGYVDCMSPVSLGLVRFDGTGTQPYAVIRGLIYRYQDGDLAAAVTKNNNMDLMFQNRKIIRQPIVGNFDGNINGREQVFFAVSTGKLSGNIYDVEIGGWYYDGSGSVMAGNGLRSSRWQTAVTNISEVVLTAPDADTNDGYIAKFKEKEYTCVDPEIMAILEAAPYFEDLKDEYRETLGGTTFGTGKGSGSGSNVQGSTRAGAYISYEQDISIFGIKIGSVEAEAASMLEWSWGVEKSTEYTYDMEFDGGRDENQVVLICTPVTIYHYDAYDVATGTWKPMDITLADQPVYTMLSVEEYNAIAEIQGDPVIGSDIVSAVPGQPSTYRTSTSGLKNVYGFNQLMDVGHGSSTVTQSISKTSSSTFSNDLVHSIDVKAGVGAGGFVVGLQGGVSVGGGWSSTDTSSLTRSGTVGEVPGGYNDYNFNWRFITWDATIGTGSQKYTVPVLGYVVTGVRQPPSMPQNVEIDPGTDSVTLTWESGFNTPAYYEVCRYVPNDPTGTYYYVQGTVLGSDAVDGEYTFTDTGLESGVQYQYTLRSVGLESSGYRPCSNYIEPISVVTASTAGAPRIVSQTEGVVSIRPNTSTTFTVIALPAGGNNLTFQWQSRDVGGSTWKNLTDKTSNKLTVTGTAAMDGTDYRCMVVELSSGSVLPVFIYSEPVKLKVGKADSTATLTANGQSPTASGSANYDKATETSSQQQVLSRYEINVGGSDTPTVYEAYAAGIDTIYRDKANGKYYRLNELILDESDETGVYTGMAASASELTALDGYLMDSSNVLSNKIITNINDLYGTAQETAVFDGVTYNVFTATGVAVQGDDPDLRQSTLTLYQKADGEDKAYYVAFENEADGTQQLYSTSLTEYGEDAYPDPLTVDTNFTFLSGTLRESWTTETKQITIGSESKDCEVYTDGSVTVYKYTEYKDIEVPVYDEEGNETGTDTVKVAVSETYYYETTTGEGETAETTYTEIAPFAQGLYGIIEDDNSVRYTVTPGAVQTTTVSVPSTVMESVSGDPVTLTVRITANNTTPTGTVTFQITNTTTGVATTRTATAGNGTAGVTWTPPAEGVYTIRAVYGGSTTAEAAASNTITYYATAGPATLYDIELPAAPQYGDTIAPSLVKWTEESSKTELVPNAAFTYHKYLGIGATGADNKGYETTGTSIPSGGISSLLPGDYLIKTTVSVGTENRTITKLLTVSKRAVTVTAPSFIVSKENASSVDWAEKQKAINVTNPDGSTCTLDADYGTAADGYSNLFTLSNNSLPASVGSYDVVPGYKNETIQSDFLSKYVPTIKRGVASVVSDYYTVNYTAGANGTLSANNITAGSRSFDSGASIQKSSALLFLAKPDDGFLVSKWTVKNATTGAVLNSGFTIGTNMLTLNSLNCNLDVTVEFSNETHKVTFGSADASTGTVTATQYGTELVSTDKVVGGSSVTFTAKPESGYVVKQWSVTKNNSTPVVQLNPDNKTPYTGATLTLDNIDADTTVTVTFEEAGDPFNVTYSAVKDQNGSFVEANDVVSFTADGLIDGKAVKGSTVKLTATVTPGTAIQKWQVSTNGTDWTDVADSVKEYTIYNLQADTQIRVLVTTSSATYPVTFGIDGGDASSQLTAAYNGKSITSGTACMAYTTVEFTYTESENYEFVRWDVTGTTGTAAGNGKTHTYTIDSLNADTEVKAVVQKKPQISIGSPANGTITVTGTIEGVEKTIENGKWVDCGTEITVTVTPADNYVVSGIKAVKTGDKSSVVKSITNDTNASGTQTLTLSPTENVTVFATFKEKPVVTVDSDIANGTVTFTGTKNGETVTQNSDDNHVDFGSSLAVTIKPDTGYEVTDVTVNNSSVTTKEVENSDNRTNTCIVPDAGATIGVTFSAIPTATVTYSVVDTNGSDDGGTNGTLTASVDRKGMSSYAVTDDKDGTETVCRDSVVTFTATPDAGYKIGKWIVNGKEQSNRPKLTISSADAQNVQVQFDPVGEAVTYGFDPAGVSDKATLSAVYQANGSTEQDDFFSGNKPTGNGVITFTVSDLADGYEVEGWYVNGVKQSDSTDLTYDYNVTANVGADVTVRIIRSSYDVTFSGENGTVSAVADGKALHSGDRVTGDTEVTFTAKPVSATGYTFSGWTVNGKASDETAESLTLTVTKNTVVKAAYTMNEVRYTVAHGVIGDENGSLSAKTLDADNTVAAGSDVVFTAAPADGYRVKGWYSDTDGTTAIPGTTFEQNSYTLENVLDNAAVYVAFEPIPTYDITVNVTGLGTVTATVNGKDTAITDNKLTVTRYDDVVLTAVPDAYQNLTGWTLDDKDQGNDSMTLTLTDVTESHTVTAGFAASQLVEFRTVVVNDEGGSLTAKAGYGEKLSTIDASTGISVEKGKNVVVTAVPNADYMVKEWKINGEVQDNLSNTLTIESLTEAVTVEVEFEALKLCGITGSYADCTVTVGERIPDDYGTVDLKQIRDRGEITFTVAPAEGEYLTELTVNGVNCLSDIESVGDANKVTARINPDKSVTVTVTNVTKDIALTAASGALEFRTEAVDLDTVPTELEDVYSAPEEMQSDLRAVVKETDRRITDDRIILFDIELQYMAEGSLTWVKATPAQFPADGITVTIPYSDLGSDVTSSDDFVVIHMFTTDMNGQTIGDTESIIPVKEENGLRFTVTSLSPFAIGWNKYTGSVTVADSTNGKVTMDSTTAQRGDTVTLTVEPDKGYTLDTLIVADESGNELELMNKGNGKFAFTMPASKVSVNATFIAVPFDMIVADSTNGKVVTDSTTAQIGDTVTLTVEPDKGYTLETLIVTDESGNELELMGEGNGKYTFTMPASKITVNATFMAVPFDIIVTDSTNGKVTTDSTMAQIGDTVTLTVEPDKGYTLETLIVTDENGNELEIMGEGNGKYTFTMPASKVTVNATFMDDNAMLNFFVDVPFEAYYFDAVMWAAETGVTVGTTEVTFSPEDICTRAQAVTFLWRAAGCPEPDSICSFSDVPEDSYYAKAVAWAVENGVTLGTSATTFSPEAYCTRAHIITFLWRAQNSPAADIENPFTDVEPGAYYYDAVMWAVAEKVTAGTSATTFSPDLGGSRGQIVTFLYRVMAE